MEIPDYSRCYNGHLLYDEERYCPVCGVGKFDYAKAMQHPGHTPGKSALGRMKCRNTNAFFHNSEKYCYECGDALIEAPKKA